ncbi:phosphoglycerate kinase [Candidatus Woesearchaeota archaeon]|nr:MAG: phosphoglycerate kinase [Candidatus Woesearchaeota archaeon]
MRKLQQAKVNNKRVLVRVDFNVPLKGGRVADDSRILYSIPTIKWLLEKKAASIILASHLGRPGGKPNKALSLRPVAKHLSKLLKMRVSFSPKEPGEEKLCLLENLRFHPVERKDSARFAKKLASYADLYVNDAFAASHRKAASVHAITRYLPSYAGLLLQKEVRELSKLTRKPKRPYVAIMGGAKVSDKIDFVQSILEKADKALIGGAIALTFIAAQGYDVGRSLFEKEKTRLAKKFLKKHADKILLPIDFRVKTPRGTIITSAEDIPKYGKGLDIGPRTERAFETQIRKAKTILWNGPMGLFENPSYRKGTAAIAKAITRNRGTTIAGGGDTLAAISKLGLTGKFTHVSTGGGAMLQFLSGKKLPGLEALKHGPDKNKSKFK